MGISSRPKIAVIGNHTPRRCGLATFTADVAQTLTQKGAHVRVVAMNDRREGYAYPDPVCFEVFQDDPVAYARAAEYLNLREYEVVNLQHEFGIFGGESGANVIPLMRELACPIVTTLHTVLRDPSPSQREVFEEVLELSSRVVVMSETGKHIINQLYRYDIDRIDLIPHGVPDVAFNEKTLHKARMRLEGRRVLLTFGLVSPSKGIEYAIQAIPKIVEKYPDVLYLVVGQTHPHIVQQFGEAYRDRLEQWVDDLGLRYNVRFHNAFVSLDDLVEYLRAADIYITPYLKLEQITSGTLSYAVGCGLANISTPLWHAEELLAEGRGIIVPPESPQAIAENAIRLFDQPTELEAMATRAYSYGRAMIWTSVGDRLLQSFHTAIRRSAPRIRRFADLPPSAQVADPVSLPFADYRHIKALTDDTGLLQHAKFSIPDRFHGYCTDDNARGLLLAAHLGDGGVQASELEPESRRYLSFLHFAFDRIAGRFRNFMAFDRTWLEECGSEDSNGRAIWALGAVTDSDLSGSVRSLSAVLLAQAIPSALRFVYPRSWAFTILGLNSYARAFAGDRFATSVQRVLAKRLMALHRKHSAAEWNWFEPFLSYDNARISQALLLAGNAMEDIQMQETALSTLEWLCRMQRDPDGTFVPIGNQGFWEQGMARPRFDQQPLEAWATVSAASTAYRLTGEPAWREEAHRAFRWFLGDNSLRTPLFDLNSGGCRDGLGPDHANENMGAESTLAYAIAQLELSKMEQVALSLAAGNTHEQSLRLS